MYYIPNLITEDEERRILDSVCPSSLPGILGISTNAAPQIPSGKWISLSKRRLQTIPSRLTATNTLLAAPLPKWLTEPIIPRFAELGLFEGAPHGVNHCLINEYLPGQGIMPHEDGAAYYPVVATVSLGGTLVLDVTEKRKQEDGAEVVEGRHPKTWRIVQESRSLLVTTGEAYTEALHGIAEVTEDIELRTETVANWDLLSEEERKVIERNGGKNVRSMRISLTYRDVKKVSSIGGKIFGRGKK
jgi:alkylated DNA repair protein alkB homolog 6